MKAKIYKNPVPPGKTPSRRPTRKFSEMKTYRASKSAQKKYGQNVKVIRPLFYVTSPEARDAGIIPGNKDPKKGWVRSEQKILSNPKGRKRKMARKRIRRNKKGLEIGGIDLNAVLVPPIAGIGTALIAEQVNKNLPASFQGLPIMMLIASAGFTYFAQQSKDDNIKYAAGGVLAITAAIILNKITWSKEKNKGMLSFIFAKYYGDKKPMGGLVNRPTIGGLVNRPTVGGLVDRPTIGGLVNRPTIGGLVDRPVISGMGLPQSDSSMSLLPQ